MSVFPQILGQMTEVRPDVPLPYTDICLGALVLIGLLLCVNYLTRSGTIARATFKEAIRQPVFFLMAALGLLSIVLNYYVPFFSLGDDTKMYIDCGLATILICALIHSIWMSSLSVAEEIEGRTAMTLLSKPINRRQFVWGKFLGIYQSAFLMIVVLGTIFFFMTYFKFGYDQSETGRLDLPHFRMIAVSWFPIDVPWFIQERYQVAQTVLPGLALLAMEVAVMTAVSVAISTRMPMMVNISACFSIFVIGNLAPVLVQSDVENEFVVFFARMLATILPGLDNFNMSHAISTDKIIPPSYLGLSLLFCMSYVAMMIMLAFLLFEDRDLA